MPSAPTARNVASRAASGLNPANWRFWLPLGLALVAVTTGIFWLGYYLALSPNAGEQGDWEILGPGGKLAQQPVELRLSRFVADGMHEDVDLTKYVDDSGEPEQRKQPRIERQRQAVGQPLH